MYCTECSVITKSITLFFIFDTFSASLIFFFSEAREQLVICICYSTLARDISDL